MTLEHVSTKMPAIQLNIKKECRVFNPDADGQVRLDLSDGRALVISVKNTGIDNQIEDWMYLAKYLDTDGNPQPGGHIFGTKGQMMTALPIIVKSLAKNGILVTNGKKK